MNCCKSLKYRSYTNQSSHQSMHIKMHWQVTSVQNVNDAISASAAKWQPFRVWELEPLLWWNPESAHKNTCKYHTEWQGHRAWAYMARTKTELNTVQKTCFHKWQSMTLNCVNKHYCAMKLQYKHISKLKLKKIDTWKLLSMSIERKCIQDFDRNTSMERSE